MLNKDDDRIESENSTHNLKVLATIHNLKQSEISSYLDVDRTTFNKWFQGNRSIPHNKLLNLSDLFGLSVDDLLLADYKTLFDKSELDTNNYKEYPDDKWGHKIAFIRRNKLCLTQGELAEGMPYHPHNLSKWEINRNFPGKGMLPLIAQQLKTSIDQLIRGDYATLNIGHCTNEPDPENHPNIGINAVITKIMYNLPIDTTLVSHQEVRLYTDYSYNSDSDSSLRLPKDIEIIRITLIKYNNIGSLEKALRSGRVDIAIGVDLNNDNIIAKRGIIEYGYFAILNQNHILWSKEPTLKETIFNIITKQSQQDGIKRVSNSDSVTISSKYIVSDEHKEMIQNIGTLLKSYGIKTRTYPAKTGDKTILNPAICVETLPLDMSFPDIPKNPTGPDYPILISANNPIYSFRRMLKTTGKDYNLEKLLDDEPLRNIL